MAEIITMPRLSDTMTEGKVSKWHKKVGDFVKEGDVLAEIETDKAIQEFESEFDGTLLYVGVKEGLAASVNTILAIIGPFGSDISSIVESNIVQSSNKKTSSSQILLQVNKTDAKKLFSSPLARKLAKSNNIDLTQIRGSGGNGRIIKKDIENFISYVENEEKVKFNSPIKTSNVKLDSETRNSQIRNIIAKRLAESKFTAPHYYLMIEICMDNIVESRSEINAILNVKISLNDIITKAVALSLRKHSQINSSWLEEKTVHYGNINIGIAVAIPDGLIVPVIKNADYLSLIEISNSIKDLAERAKNKSLKANEIEGSTFSISNLGMFGIETFTSIINQPNSCILSVGSIFQKPIVKNNTIIIGNIMKLSLACDHRVVDGAVGAQFLQTLKSYLEKPITMLV